MKKILPAALLVIIVLFALSAFRIQDVEAPQNSCIKSIPDYKGKLIFTLNASREEAKIKESDPCISSVKIEKSLPSKIKITIEAEVPVAQIAGTQLFVMANGTITQSEKSNLPQIFLPKSENLTAGGQLSKNLSKTAVTIAGLLAKSDFHPTNIRILNSGDIAVYDAAEAVVIFTPEKSPQEQVDSLQQVIAIAKIDNDKIAKIDLRFDKPTIVFK